MLRGDRLRASWHRGGFSIDFLLRWLPDIHDDLSRFTFTPIVPRVVLDEYLEEVGDLDDSAIDWRRKGLRQVLLIFGHILTDMRCLFLLRRDDQTLLKALRRARGDACSAIRCKDCALTCGPSELASIFGPVAPD